MSNLTLSKIRKLSTKKINKLVSEIQDKRSAYIMDTGSDDVNVRLNKLGTFSSELEMYWLVLDVREQLA